MMSLVAVRQEGINTVFADSPHQTTTILEPGYGMSIDDIVSVQPVAGHNPLLTYRRAQMHHGTTMKMTFKVDELLKTLKANLKDHKKIIKEAKIGFKKALVIELKEMLAKAKAGEDFQRHIKATPPGDNSRDYERTIKMLEMTTDEELDLTGDQFECYVMDRWDWQDAFLNTCSGYNVSAVQKMSEY